MRSSRALILIWLVFAAFLSAAIALEAPKGGVRGVVRGRDGKPVKGATVSLYKKPFHAVVRTGEDGSFLLRDVPVEGYSLHVKAVGYSWAAYPKQVEVKEGEITTLEPISLAPVPPYLYLTMEKRAWYPGDSVTLSLRGVIHDPGVKMTLFAVDEAVVDEKKGDLEQIDRVNPLKPSRVTVRPVKSWSETLKEVDEWGAYSQSLSFDLEKPGVYLLLVEGEKFKKQLSFVVTRVSLVAKQAPEELFLWAVDLKSGEPLADVTLTILSQSGKKVEGKSHPDGSFALSLDRSHSSESAGQFYVKGRSGDSLSFLYSGGGESGRKNLVYFYTDRPVYRPGHVVAFKGIVRDETSQGYSVYGNKEVKVRIQDPEGEQVYQKSLKTNEFGSFHDTFQLDEEARVGEYQVMTAAASLESYSTIAVEAYRKPEYKIEFVTRKRYSQGETVPVKVKVGYFFGAPTPGAKVEYTVYKSRYWYWSGDIYEEFFDEDLWYATYYRYGEIAASGEGNTNQDGILEIPVTCPREEEDAEYTVEVSVTDPSRKTVTATHSFLATRGDFFLRVSSDRYAYSPDEKVKVSISALNFDGEVVKDLPVEVVLEEVRWNQKEYTETSTPLQTFPLSTDRGGKGFLTISPPHQGEFRVRVKAGQVTAAGTFLVAKEGEWWWGRYGDRTLGLTLDKKIYRTGETARIFVSASSSPKAVLLTVEGPRLYLKKILDLSRGGAAFSLPILPEYLPSVTITATYLKDGESFEESKLLYVDPGKQFLQVSIVSSKSRYLPGEEAVYDITTTDFSGKPVSAEVSFGAVDEAIYAVKAEQAPDIRKFFYGRRSNLVSTTYSFPHGYWGGMEKELGVEEIRRNFKDTAYWLPSVVTDSKGEARVTFRFPDNLTSWRATVRAHTRDTRVGSLSQWVTVTKDLLIRLEVPRFFTQNDRARINAVVHNYTGKDQTVEVRISARGVEIADPQPRKLLIKDGGLERVEWEARVTNPGTATIAASCVASVPVGAGASDAMELSLPVFPHGLPFREGKSGEVRAHEAVQVDLPPDLIEEATTLSISLSPSVASSLFSVLSYLQDFHYTSAEGLMDVILPNVVMVEALRSLGIKEPRMEKEIPKTVRSNLKVVYDWQREDGMWGWGSYDSGDNFMTAYVIYGLYHAQKAGFPVRKDLLKKGAQALIREIPEEKNLDIKATMLYVLSFLDSGGAPAGESPSTRRKSELEESGFSAKESREAAAAIQNALSEVSFSLPRLQSYSTALLALAYRNLGKQNEAREAIALLKRKAEVTETTAFWSEIFPWGFYSCNNFETTGYALKALIAVAPDDPLIPKAARWLLLSRSGSRWSANYDTAAVVYALADYIKKYQEMDPDYTARVMVNGKPIKEIRVTRDDLFKPEITLKVNGKDLQKGANSIIIEKEGKGSLYYTTLLSGFKKGENFHGESHGVTIERQYLRVRTKETPKGKMIFETAPLEGAVQAGEILEVRLKVKGAHEGAHLVVEDEIPSGFEVVPRSQEGWGYWWAGEERRDQKMLFLLRYFYPKEWEISYRIRAELPGIFHALPPRGYGMYIPEISGSGSETILEVR